MSGHVFRLKLTAREIAIVGAALRRCIGWDDMRELQRFVNIASASVREGWTDDEMNDVLETICEQYQDANNGSSL